MVPVLDPDDFIGKRKDAYVKLLCDLIRAKTVNPPGDEHIAAKVVRKRLSKIGVKCKAYEKKKRRTNLIAKVGDERGRKVLISTHLDVVPAGDGWDTDPFEPVVKDGILYGRGASDDKGQATAALLVLDCLKSIEKRLKNQYIFVFAADEEQGSSLGLHHLLKENIISPDLAIIPDVCGAMKKITIAEKGVLNLKITANGKQSHGSTPHKGVSAIACMSKFIAKLEHHILKHSLHKYLSRPTINFGTIKGGSAPNIVAGSCELIVNIRYLPSQDAGSIIAELKKISERFGEFSFEKLVDIPPTEIDDSHMLVETIRKVAERHGIKAKPYGMSGATDTKAFVMKGIPAVGYDFADDYVPHNANEYCRLDNLFRFSRIMVDVCLELDGKQA